MNEKVTNCPSEPQQNTYGGFWAPGQTDSVGRLVADAPAAITCVPPVEAAVTVAVWALLAGAPGPPALDAVTVTVRVFPTSVTVGTYEVAVAPPIAAQPGVQRFH